MKFPTYEAQLLKMRTAFNPVAEKFELRETYFKVNAYGALIRLQNETTGLEVEFSPKEEPGIRVTIIRIINGQVPPYPIHIDEETEVHYFDVRGVAALRLDKLDAHLRSIIVNQSSLDAEEAAALVMECCDDILKGDFSLFPTLEKMLKERAKQLAADFPARS